MYPKKLESDHLRKPKNIGKHKIKINLGGLAGRWGTIKKWLLWAGVLPIILLIGVFLNKQYSSWENLVTTPPDRKQEVVLPHDQDKKDIWRETHAAPPSLEKNDSQRASVTNPPPGDKRSEVSPTSALKQPGSELKALQSSQSPKTDKNPIEIKTAIEIKARHQTTVVPPAPQVKRLPQPAPNSSAKLPKPQPQSSVSSLSEPRPARSEPSPVKKTTPPLKGKEVTKLLHECQVLLKANRLIAGKGNTAFACYHQVLVQDSHNAEAKAGLNEIESRYQEWASNALQKKQLSKARGHIRRLRQLNPQSPALPNLQQRLVELERAAASPPAPPTVPVPPKRSPQQQSTSSSPAKSVAPRPKGESSGVRPPVAPQRPLSPSSPRSTPTAQSSRPPNSPESSPPPPQSSRPQPPRCGEIFIQESLGIQPLTQEQREFKRTNCN